MKIKIFPIAIWRKCFWKEFTAAELLVLSVPGGAYHLLRYVRLPMSCWACSSYWEMVSISHDLVLLHTEAKEEKGEDKNSCMVHFQETEEAPEHTQQRGAARWGSCPGRENVPFPMSIPWQIFAWTKQAHSIGYSFCKQKAQKMFIWFHTLAVTVEIKHSASHFRCQIRRQLANEAIKPEINYRLHELLLFSSVNYVTVNHGVNSWEFCTTPPCIFHK